ncbi:hypothetical protein [Cystobacter ferrugineus]|uniref:hypothetical protein n=1 Tax=Cystobacter ferrugineus TaxID=83449 RepID=UPI000AA447A4|nr:hypothetical protein [Cystobacter ferrugineus]
MLLCGGNVELSKLVEILQLGRDVHLASQEALWRFLNQAWAPNTRLEFGVDEGTRLR